MNTIVAMVEKEIEKAKELFDLYGEHILNDENCLGFLKNYRLAIETTWKTMERLNIIKACSACSGKRVGGCCFSGVEDWYDHILFLINILLGAKIPDSGTVKDGCKFVGETGCLLLARHSFCINYLCDNLKEMISSPDRKELMSISGNEIHCGIQTEQSIRNWLSQHCNGQSST